MRFSSAILIAAFLMPLLARSDVNPSPQSASVPRKSEHDQARGREPQNNSSSQNKVTVETLPTVNAVISGSLNVHSDDPKPQSQENHSNFWDMKFSDVLTVVFTGFLVVVGGGQVWVMRRQAGIMASQASIMETQAKIQEDTLTEIRNDIEASRNSEERQAEHTRDALEATKKAADAADLQAKAMIASFRALIEFPFIPRPRIIRPLSNEIFQPGSLYDTAILILPIQNKGARPATIIGVDMNWTIAPEPPLIPDYAGMVSINATVQQGQIIEIPIVDRPTGLSPKMEGRIRAGELWWYYGYLRYRDFMDDIWEVGFVGHWEEIGRGVPPLPARGIVSEGPQSYMYTKKITDDGA